MGWAGIGAENRAREDLYCRDKHFITIYHSENMFIRRYALSIRNRVINIELFFCTTIAALRDSRGSDPSPLLRSRSLEYPVGGAGIT